jgi:signal recognition particle subunit SRP19
MVMLMDEVIIWPSFLDANLTRKQGRRLAKKFCIRSPDVEEMLAAAEKIGLKARVDKKAYPRRWHVEKRALVLEERKSRGEILSGLAREMRQSRAE